jgi:hypothetical protein
MSSIRQIIITTARPYIGEKEKLTNGGFENPETERKMKAIGWAVPDPWCAFAAKMIWLESYQKYDATYHDELNKLMTGSAVQTFNNFKRSNDWYTSQMPVVGSIVIWQKYKDFIPQWTGHAGIVEVVYPDFSSIVTIEGNSNSHGGREGIEFANLKRKVDFAKVKTGLNLLGFIHPRD